MANENFLTYTEVDPTSKLTVASDSITFASVTNNDNCYVYKDYGADYFNGDFIVTVQGKITGGADFGKVFIWGLANEVSDFGTIDAGGGDYLGVALFDGTVPDPYSVRVDECVAGSMQMSYVIIATGTDYWIKIVRDESISTFGRITIYVYSDETMETLVASNYLTLREKEDFRYAYGLSSLDENQAGRTLSGYAKNLNLEALMTPVLTSTELVSVTPTTADVKGYIKSVGNTAVTAHGICWATTMDPTTSDSTTDEGAGTVGYFTSTATSLTPNQRYFMRPYATNSYGTGYGPNIMINAGDALSSMKHGNLAVVQGRLQYIDYYGQERYIEGSPID